MEREKALGKDHFYFGFKVLSVDQRLKILNFTTHLRYIEKETFFCITLFNFNYRQ